MENPNFPQSVLSKDVFSLKDPHVETFDSLISNIIKNENHEILLEAIKGDAKSIGQVLQQYTPLVHKLVNKYCVYIDKGSKEDLVQEGMVGIHKALKTFDTERGTSFMTWVYHKVRGEVQNFARKEQRRNPQNLVKTADIEYLKSHWDLSGELSKETIVEPDAVESAKRIRKLLTETCGSLESKRAQIICNRFGLLGKEPLRQGEVAAKFNMTKQAVNSHISQFSKKVREKYPDLYQSVLGG